jgi:hypothetical protein
MAVQDSQEMALYNAKLCGTRHVVDVLRRALRVRRRRLIGRPGVERSRNADVPCAAGFAYAASRARTIDRHSAVRAKRSER